jgi:pyrroline-5-carboxylate reductase
MTQLRSTARIMTFTLSVIGGGNMGQAIIRGAIAAGAVRPAETIVAEIDRERRAVFESLGCAVTDDAKAASEAPQIMLAVKPQAFDGVAGVVGALPADTIVISIMAGLSSKAIRTALGGQCRVVRVMPNTPCQVGAGMMAVALGAGTRPGDDELARQLFVPLGKVISIDESLMYAVTGVSGSGPAYVFLLAQLMEQSAVQLGISAKDARTLVTQTILGAARMLDECDLDAETLRRNVTSPGGTTEAALRVMFEGKLPEVVVSAITAARNRGRELDRT